jgi:aminoglycoside phosphotransferase (APT) family kinase protein
VYLVKTADASFVLKVTGNEDSAETRSRRARIQTLAGEQGVAPRVVHVDEGRRAVLTTFVQDQGFGPMYGNPATRHTALQKLADTLRTVHAMDPRDAATGVGPEAFLDTVWADLQSRGEPPAFVCDVIKRVRASAPPTSDRPRVLSHNDVNPTNIVYDGTRVVLLDWDTSSPNSPFYDLAAASVFFRMDDTTSLALIAEYDGASMSAIPRDFRYNQALVAALCGVTFLRLAAIDGFTAPVERAEITSLEEIYARMRTGQFDIASATGKWQFGLALLLAGEAYTLGM